MSSPIPEIVVSYGGGGDSTCVDIGIVPSLELQDEEVEEATSNLYEFLRSAFHLPCESKLTLHETESGRILSNETFRDPSFVSNFPRYWYLTAGNGFNAPHITSMFQSLSMDDSTVSVVAQLEHMYMYVNVPRKLELYGSTGMPFVCFPLHRNEKSRSTRLLYIRTMNYIIYSVDVLYMCTYM